MNKRFEVGGAVTAATPLVYRLFNAAENPTYYNKDGAAVTADHMMSALKVTSYGAFKLEIGLCDTNGTNFTPYYPTFATLATAGGIVAHWQEQQYLFPFSETRVLAVRITVYADATVYAAGDVDFRERS